VRTQTTGDFDRTVNSDRLSGYFEFATGIGELSKIVARAQRSYYEWSSDMKPITTGTASHSSLDQTTDQFEGRWMSTLFDQHRVTAGLEYRMEDRKDDSTSHDVQNFAVLLQDEMEFFKQLGLTVGVRYDNHSDFGSAISPKAASYYRLTENIRLKGSYGEGFRAPSVYELYTGSLYTKKKILNANPNLDPEKSRTYELGVDATYGAFSFGVTAFRNDMRDMIWEIQTATVKQGKTVIPVYDLRNIDKAMTQGLEINADAALPFGLGLSDALTIMDTEDKATGKDLLYVPNISNIFKITYSNSEIGLRANVRFVTTGKQSIENDEEADGYTLVNLYGAKTLGSLFELYIGVDNIFNTEARRAYGNIGGPGTVGTFFYSGLTLRL
ncbi:MAG: TonB-dependent receptor, partial [Chlorobiales bacterium]|nr:TonB-dependent receptor [Chlorobiales bacterium]